MKRAHSKLKKLGVIRPLVDLPSRPSEADRVALADFIEGRFVPSFARPNLFAALAGGSELPPAPSQVDLSVEAEPMFFLLRELGGSDSDLKLALEIHANLVANNLQSKREHIRNAVRRSVQRSRLAWAGPQAVGAATAVLLLALETFVRDSTDGWLTRARSLWFDNQSKWITCENAYLFRSEDGAERPSLERRWCDLLDRVIARHASSYNDYYADYNSYAKYREDGVGAAKRAAFHLRYPTSPSQAPAGKGRGRLRPHFARGARS